MKQDLEAKRHSLAHLMASAVQELYPNAKFGIGPAIENGFYYDFDLPESLTVADLPKIEKEMKKRLAADLAFVKKEMKLSEAIKLFQKLKQSYKGELLNDLKKEFASRRIAKATIYQTGDFIDLCRGPHVKSTKDLAGLAFKLVSIAGAYWRGSEKNKMLQRIYGLAFNNQKELDDYLKNLEEAEKRDHRKLGKELDLFSFHEVAPGMPFFHPKGAIIYNELKNFWLAAQKEFNYDMIQAPSMLDVSIWKQSGHWDHYRDDIYFIKADKGEKEYALRPMDCPGAILIYNNSLHSYRELPLRYAEPGLITRKEKSGQLSGLFRVQQFIQDDAHIFLTEDQIEQEIKNVINLVDKIYKPFGLKYKVYLSTRPDDFMGDIKSWEKAEKALKYVLDKVYGKNKYEIKEKDGAFYGPKIDYHLIDSLGRSWQCATIQLDFVMPEKFNCRYIDSGGKEKTPALIHRTIMGSFERFIGILLEHYAGALPVWLSPVQVQIIPVGQGHIEAANKLMEKLKVENIRAEVDELNETVGNKIRKAEKQKTPYMLVIGDKEKGLKKVAVRARGEKQAEEMGLDKFLNKIISEIKEKKYD
ncbi:MAG: threonine--tRNA ligase [bacterium]